MICMYLCISFIPHSWSSNSDSLVANMIDLYKPISKKWSNPIIHFWSTKSKTHSLATNRGIEDSLFLSRIGIRAATILRQPSVETWPAKKETQPTKTSRSFFQAPKKKCRNLIFQTISTKLWRKKSLIFESFQLKYDAYVVDKSSFMLWW